MRKVVRRKAVFVLFFYFFCNWFLATLAECAEVTHHAWRICDQFVEMMDGPVIHSLTDVAVYESHRREKGIQAGKFLLSIFPVSVGARSRARSCILAYAAAKHPKLYGIYDRESEILLDGKRLMAAIFDLARSISALPSDFGSREEWEVALKKSGVRLPKDLSF